jgi:tetratricopeptide (TPR) repeat protein
MDAQISHLLGLSVQALQQNNYDQAEKLLQEVLVAEPVHPDALRFMGILYAMKRNWPAALALIDQALELNPDNAFAHSNKGNILQELGRVEDAIESYDKAIALAPDNVEVYNNKGNALQALNKFADSLEWYEKAITLAPQYAMAYNNKGNALQELKQFNEAIDCYNKALALGNCADSAFTGIGVVLQQLKRYEEALTFFDKALGLNSQYVEAWTNKGIALKSLRRFEDGLICFDKALALRENNADAWANKGAVLNEITRYEEALACFDKALKINPQHVLTWYNKGINFADRKLFNDSLQAYEQAIILQTDNADAKWNKALIDLTIGNFKNGWSLYESRWLSKNPPSRRHQDLPALESLESGIGKTVLVWSEQGLGDTFQFSRYINELMKLDVKLVFEVQPSLKELMANQFSCPVIGFDDPLNTTIDYQAPLLSLPLLLGTELESIPATESYLKCDEEKSQAWKARLISSSALRVGLVWSGGFRADQPDAWPINERRNIPLSKIAKLQEVQGINFFSLQKGDPAESELRLQKEKYWPAKNLLNYVDELKDFSDTAALINHLDLIISVDTSTAHLAAAMGKKVWLLNRYDSCWRWMVDQEHSPWYPSLTIYNQAHPGNWDEVIERVGKDLKELALSH